MIFVSFSIEKKSPALTVLPVSHLTHKPTKSNLYLVNSLATAISESDLQASYSPRTKSYVPFALLRLHHRINPGPRQMYPFCNKASFYSDNLFAPCPSPKLENHPSSAVHDCLFNIFAATLHIGGCSYIHNLKTRHAVVMWANLSWP
jgi:hypothetical protein